MLRIGIIIALVLFLEKFVLYLEYDRPHAKVNDKMDDTPGMCKSIVNPVGVRARSFEQE